MKYLVLSGGIDKSSRLDPSVGLYDRYDRIISDGQLRLSSSRARRVHGETKHEERRRPLEKARVSRRK